MLRVASLLAALAIAAAAPTGTPCGKTDIFVQDTLNIKNLVFAPNSDCIYVITWKADTAAYITAHIDGLTPDDDAGLVNHFDGGKYLSIGNDRYGVNREVSTYFAPGAVYLNVRTGATSTATLSYSVTVAKVTRGASVKSAGQVVAASQPITITEPFESGKTTVYTSASQIVFNVVTSGETSELYYDSVFVYDGQGPTAKLLGTLLNFVKGQGTLLSSNTISFYPVGAPAVVGIIVVNNKQNVNAFNFPSMMSFWSRRVDSKTSTVLLEGRQGLGSTSIVNFAPKNGKSEYPIITSISFSDETATAKIYSGLPSSNMQGNFIASYTDATGETMAARAFPGTAITITIDKGFARVKYTSAYYN